MRPLVCRPTIAGALSRRTVFATLLVPLAVGLLWVGHEVTHFREHAAELRSQELETRKDDARGRVDDALRLVRLAQSRIQDRALAAARRVALGAHAVLTQVDAALGPGADPGARETALVAALRAFAEGGGADLVFAASDDGRVLVWSGGPDAPSVDAVALGRAAEVVAVLGEGFCSYGGGAGGRRGLAFVRAAEPLGWLVGAGVSLSAAEARVQAEVLEVLEGARFGDDGYLFAGRLDGTLLTAPLRGQLGWDHVDRYGVRVFRDIIAKAQSGGGFVSYGFPRPGGDVEEAKLSYVTVVPGWDWFLGAGLYLADVEAAAGRERAALDHRLAEVLALIGATVIGLLSLGLWVSGRTARKLDRSFGDLRGRVAAAAGGPTGAPDLEAGSLGFADLDEIAGHVCRIVADRREAERAAERYRGELETLLDTTPDLVFRLDRDGRFTFVNRAVLRYGYRPEEVLGREVLAFLHPDDRARAAARLAARRAGDRSVLGLEVRLVAASGQVFHLETLAAGGEAGESQGVARDVTDRRDAAERLRQSEALLRTVVHSLPFEFWARDGEGRCVVQNERSRSRWGDQRGRLVLESRVPPLVRERWEDDLRRAFLGETVRARRSAREGDRVAHFQEVIAPIRDGERVLGVLGIHIDVTTQVEAESRLQHSEAHYRALFAVARDAIFVLRDGRVVEANAAAEQLFGMPAAALAGRTPAELSPPGQEDDAASAPAAERHLAAALASGAERAEWVCARADGSPFETEVSLSRFEVGGEAHVLAAVRDVSDRRRLERERATLEAHLAQAQKMEAIGTLAGGIAHDFNNILGAIVGYAEMSLGLQPGDPGLRRNLGRVLQAAERAADLVRQILAFSRQRRSEARPTQVRLIAKEVLRLLRATLPATVEIRAELGSDAAVLADPTQIHQVLMNLCTNAGLAMRARGGILGVTLEEVRLDETFARRHPPLRPGRHLEFTVRDTGCGIAPAHLGRVFEPFFTTRPEGEGTGMGLAVVHGVVHGCGGTVTVESEVEVGTVFRVLLPIAEGADPFEPAPPPAPAVGTETVLFIDDEVMHVDLAREALGRLGYRVAAFTRSCEALAAFRSSPHAYDIVVTDVTMPAPTGEDVLREVRSVRPDLPVIVATGYSERLDEARARSLGADAYVLKPVVMAELSQLIHQVIRTRAH